MCPQSDWEGLGHQAWVSALCQLACKSWPLGERGSWAGPDMKLLRTCGLEATEKGLHLRSLLREAGDRGGQRHWHGYGGPCHPAEPGYSYSCILFSVGPGIRPLSPAADEPTGLKSVQGVPAPLAPPRPNWEVLLPGPGVHLPTPLGPPTFSSLSSRDAYVFPFPSQA